MSKSWWSFVVSICVVLFTSFGVTASENSEGLVEPYAIEGTYFDRDMVSERDISFDRDIVFDRDIAFERNTVEHLSVSAPHQEKRHAFSADAHVPALADTSKRPTSTRPDESRIKAILSNLRWISSGNETSEFESANFGLITEVGDSPCCFKIGLNTDAPLVYLSYFLFHTSEHRVNGWKDSNTFYVALNSQYV
ncbi:hypothetical protein BCU66_011545 [Vibrio sp. 10N.286.49.B1]|uniref:hypothetical protein n=1 Tax=unclassified Vibrio TaxID=2614977 RepID=UPI001054FEDB|nr:MULTISPECIES: hypothetical protein [unclassified Vibrio]